MATQRTVRTTTATSTNTDSPRITPPTTTSHSNARLPFERMNYILLIIGIVMIALGFFLMRGEYVDATKFSVPLYVAPVIVVAGFLEIVYAIMYTPKKAERSTDETVKL